MSCYNNLGFYDGEFSGRISDIFQKLQIQKIENKKFIIKTYKKEWANGKVGLYEKIT